MQNRQFAVQVRESVRETVDRLATLVSPEHAELFTDDALRHIADSYRRTPPRAVPSADDIAGALTQRLKLYGITPEKAAAALQDHQDPSTPPPPTPRGAAAEALARKGPGQPVDGAKLVRAAATRKAIAAAAPGAGAGPGVPRVQPPKGLTITGKNNVFTYLREQVLGRGAPR
jgi:hypothetical protein